MNIKTLTQKELACIAQAKREALEFNAGHLDRDVVSSIAREEMPWHKDIKYVENLSDVPKGSRLEFSYSWAHWLVHRIEGHYLTGDDTYERGKIASWVSPETREEVKQAERLLALGRACGAVFSTENCTLYVIPVPEVHWSNDETPVLHRPDGPACVFGGLESYYWRGNKVPREWIVGDGPSVEDALRHPNIEMRRCAAEILGWGTILESTNARVINEDPDPMVGTLLEVDLPDSPGTRFLKVLCGTGRTHVIPVPSNMEFAKQANAWTYHVEDGWENWKPPAIRT